MERWKPDERNGSLPCVKPNPCKTNTKDGREKTDDTSANTTHRDIRSGAVEKDGEIFICF